MGCGEAPRNRCVPSWCGGGGCVGPRTLVVCARRCPTLPLPGGGSTIGAGGLSFRVRNGCRAWHPRYDRRDVYVSAPPRVWGVVRVVVGPPSPRLGVVGVGRGPHSGRARRVCRVPTRPVSPGGWVCCLCRPISASQLEWPLRAVHSWSINPVVYWGPPTTPKGWCGYLILKMVSRLDAFSGYPSRT